jgi:transcription-repair coupling factor (superfamily II helicase)
MSEKLSEIVDLIRDFEPVRNLLQNKDLVRFEHVFDGAQAFVAACVVRHHASRSCWIVCPDVRRQEELFNGLLSWQVDALFFPEMEIPAIREAVPDPEIAAERLEVLQKVSEGKRAVIVLTEGSLQDKVPAAQALQKQTRVIKRNDRLDRDVLCESLLNSGYVKVPQVTTRGQIAARGGILDIFSWHHSLPVRIELFGDQVDSIREFELDDQTSIRRLDRCEVLVGDAEQLDVGLNSYFLKGDIFVGIDCEPEGLQVSITAGASLGDSVEDYRTAFYETGFQGFEAGDFLVEESKRELALQQVRTWIQDQWRVIAVCHNEGEIERLRDVLRDNDVEVEQVQFLLGSLNRGFVFPEGKLAVL